MSSLPALNFIGDEEFACPGERVVDTVHADVGHGAVVDRRAEIQRAKVRVIVWRRRRFRVCGLLHLVIPFPPRRGRWRWPMLWSVAASRAEVFGVEVVGGGPAAGAARFFDWAGHQVSHPDRANAHGTAGGGSALERMRPLSHS
jgi:hypothetical protein